MTPTLSKCLTFLEFLTILLYFVHASSEVHESVRETRAVPKSGKSIGIGKAKTTTTTPRSTQGDDQNGLSESDRQRLINEETLRMIKMEVKFLLENTTAPRLNLLEKGTINQVWILLQKAKEVFAAV
jgi:hypothetical protein